MKCTVTKSACLAVLLSAGAALSAGQTINPKFAGTWVENEAKRQIGSSVPLRFRDTGGQLEELRGPVEKPLAQPVRFGAKPYSVDNSKNMIEWKKIDDSHFERKLYEGGKLLTTRTIEISADGKTMTEVTRREASDVETHTFKRAGEDKGLTGTWTRTAVRTNSPATLTIEVSAAGMKTTSRRGVTQSLTFDGKPVPVTGPATISGTMVAAKLKDANTVETTASREGVVTSTGTMVLSSDGKTLTSTTTLKSGKEPGVIVYQRK